MDQSSLMPMVFSAAIVAAAGCFAAIVFKSFNAGPEAPRYAKIARRASALLVLGACCAGGYALFLLATGNVHTVIAGELYRSGQVTPAMIADLKQRYGIRAILNLRGRNEKKLWYREEIASAAAHNIAHFDYTMSMKRQMSEANWTDLIAIMRAAPKPLLIHCQGGSDRTGLASALYLSAIKGNDDATAEAQLSVRFGHIGLPYLSRSYAMDATYGIYETLRGKHATDDVSQTPAAIDASH